MISRLYFSKTLLLVAVLAPLAASCEKMFDIHPYDVQFDGPRHHNIRAIEQIEERCADVDTLRVAFISDSHQWYPDARDIVRDINRRGNIDFVVHCGDLTNRGARKEFLWFRSEVLDHLEPPCLVMLGNHDCLGTGEEAYRILFGKSDFAVVAGGVKFVCLNTNAAEYDYMADVPNFPFIEQEAEVGSRPFDRTVVVMHAPPYCEQFNNNVAMVFRRSLDNYPGLQCCVFGHLHMSVVKQYYDDSLTFYGVANAKSRQYRIFTFTPSGYEQTLVSL